MPHTQKIYYNNKPLVLTNDPQTYITNNKFADGYLLLKGAFKRNFRLAIDHLSRFRTLGAIIEDISVDALQNELHQLYKPVDAGGGIVLNEKGKVLMIYRRGKWDLPKGKRDDGEDIAECALREVSEETGLQKLQLKDRVCDTFHIYNQNGDQMLKHTAWFQMSASEKENLAPQQEENILEARWIAEQDLKPIVYKSYEAIREVLSAAGLKWQ